VLVRKEAACEQGEIKMPSGLEFSANPAIIGAMSMPFLEMTAASDGPGKGFWQ